MATIKLFESWLKDQLNPIMEAVSWDDDLVAVTAGNEIKYLVEYDSIDIDQQEDNEIWSTMTKLVGPEAAPNLYVSKAGAGSGGAAIINSDSRRKDIFNAILMGIAQYAGDKTIFNDKAKIKELLPNLKLSIVQEGSVELIGPEANKVNTAGRVYHASKIVEVDKTSASTLNSICGYINGFNLQNWAAGNFTQYDPTKILNSNKIVDLTRNGAATIVEKGYLTLVTPATASVEAGSRETTTELTQGEEGKTGAVDIAFTVGKSDIDVSGVRVDANHPKVKEIGDKIIRYLGETGIADSITLTSSASPEYAEDKGGPKTLADYATKKKPTSGIAAPAQVVDLYDQNAKLAYDRGVTFSNALIQYLGGHVKANSIKVGWKISTDAPGNGRNISYNIATKSIAPQPIQKTQYQGAKVTVTRGNNTIYIYKIKFMANAVIGEGTRKAKAYEDLVKGDVVKIKGTVNGVVSDKSKDRKEVTVSKFEDNKMYVKVPAKDDTGAVIKDQFTDKYIEKERYIGLVAKQQKAESEI